MNEEKVVKLFRGITGIGDDLIEEAQAAGVVKKMPLWRRWSGLVACLCLAAALGAGAWRWMGPGTSPKASGNSASVTADALTDELEEEFGPDSDEIDGVPELDYDEMEDEIADSLPESDGNESWGDGRPTLPGGIAPVLRVGDTLYRWTRIAQKVVLDPGGSYSIVGTADTYLPAGYEPYGEVGGVTAEEPLEDLQLQAGFEAAGTVFTSEEHPAVVYVLMTTDWFEDTYVRFASDALGGNELLSWQGRTYLFSVNYGVCEVVKELPEGCEPVGTLHFVGDDSIPAGDLETNCRGDRYGKPIEGREAYAVPGDDSALYVYEHQYWREGDYPAWRTCPLLEP